MTGTLQVLRLKKLLFYGSYKELGTYFGVMLEAKKLKHSIESVPIRLAFQATFGLTKSIFLAPTSFAVLFRNIFSFRRSRDDL